MIDTNASASASGHTQVMPGLDHPPAGLSSGSLPQLVSGLLQVTRGVNFSSLAYGFGAGLTSWTPLLADGGVGGGCLGDLGSPHHVEFATQCTEAAVRLTIALCSASSATTAAASSDSHDSLNSKWCSVAYNLLEAIESSNPSTVQPSNTAARRRKMTLAEQRLAALLKSVSSPRQRFSFLFTSKPVANEMCLLGLFCCHTKLLILLVGPKHYRQLKDIHMLGQMINRLRAICLGSGASGQSSTSSTAATDPLLLAAPPTTEANQPPSSASASSQTTLLPPKKLQLSYQDECSLVRRAVLLFEGGVFPGLVKGVLFGFVLLLVFSLSPVVLRSCLPEHRCTPSVDLATTLYPSPRYQSFLLHFLLLLLLPLLLSSAFCSSDLLGVSCLWFILLLLDHLLLYAANLLFMVATSLQVHDALAKELLNLVLLAVATVDRSRSSHTPISPVAEVSAVLPHSPLST